MTISDDEIDELRELACDGLDQEGGIGGAFKAGQWAEANRVELCRAVLKLADEVEAQRARIDEQSEVIAELNDVVDQLAYGQLFDQVMAEEWE